MDFKLAIVSHQPLSIVGGVPIHLKQLAEAFIKLSVDIEVIAPYNKRVSSETFQYNFGLTLIEEDNYKLGPINAIKYSYKVYKYILENRRRFDAVHGSQWSNTFNSIYKNRLGILLLTKFHGSTIHTAYNDFRYGCLPNYGLLTTAPVYFGLETIILNKSDAVICISKGLLYELSPFILKKNTNIVKTVIYNGVNHEIFKPLRNEDIDIFKQKIGLDDDYKCVLYVGRIDPLKGIHSLIRVINELSISKIKLVIVGDLKENPKYSRYLLNLVKDKGRVIFLGEVQHYELPRIYNMCDVFVAPSIYEPFGNSILEAMSCGKPVITTTNAGIKEVIRNGKTGFLVGFKNLEAQLTYYLEMILTDDHLAQKIGEEARKFVIKNLSWENTALCTLNLIKKLYHS
jgi:glycosyltransferase involved in cell wall biosynthesis